MLAGGVRVSAQRFVVRAAPNPGAAARLGMIMGRKAAKRAVDRNRAKRLTREVFRAVRAELPAWDVVFQLRNNLRTSDNRVVRAELTRLLQELRRRVATQS